jgi:hypothetical protein
MPTLVCRTSSASKTKCGYDEFGEPSSPPKKYMRSSISGAIVITNYYDGLCEDCQEVYTATLSGYCEYDRSTCALTIAGNANTHITGSGCVGKAVDEDSDACGIAVNISDQDLVITQTTITMSGSGACTSGQKTTGTASQTLSSEYTTALLESDVTAALPSYGSYSDGDCGGAYYDVSDDELTITKQKMQYKFTLPNLTGYACYKLTWNERFVAEGGSVTNTAKTYQWDGSATETGEYTIDVPAAEGTTTITDLVASNACS